MNYFAFSGLVNGLVATVCGTVVYFQNRHSRKNQIYALYCLATCVWCYFYYLWFSTDDYSKSLFFSRALMMGAVFIPTLHYHHIVTLFDMETPARRKTLKVFYALDLFFFAFVFTPYFIADVGQKMSIRYWQIPGPLYHPFLALFLFKVFLGVRLLWIKSKEATPVVKNEIHWIAVATTIGYTSGCTNFCLQYDIPIPPYPNILVCLYMVIAAFLFFRLGLLDVKLVLKHVSVVLLIYGSLLVIVLAAAIPIATHMLLTRSSNPVGTLLIFGLAIGGTLSIGPFIYAYLVRHKAWLRGHMADGLTHELKSPLGIITGVLDHLQSKEGLTGDATRTAEYLEMIRRNVIRLDRNVGDLLQIARLNDGDVNIQKTVFAINDAAKIALERHVTEAITKGLSMSLQDTIPIEIFADQEKITMVLSNLLSNAIKYSESGTIAIRIEKRTDEVRCTVADQGRGVPTNDLRKIFDRFYQGKNAKGSGLGLAIAKGLIDAHGGKIWAESEGEGKGTTIVFSIPLGYSTS